MKNVFLFIVAAIVVVGMSLRVPILHEDKQEVKLYIQGEIEQTSDFTVIKNGSDSIVRCDGDTARTLVRKYNTLCVTFKESGEFMNVLSKYNMNILYVEKVGDITNYFGYTHKYNFKDVLVDGQTINMQIAKRQNDIVVGFPIIFTDY